MRPQPLDDDPAYRASGKLAGKVALITGGDSGIGRAVAICYAKEGAHVAIVYLEEHDDAAETARRVEAYGRRCVCIAGDVGDPAFCRAAVDRTADELGGLDILVNNAGEQHVNRAFVDIEPEQLERTIRTNLFGYVYMAQAAIPKLREGGAIVQTTSIQAFHPSPELADYAMTKAAGVNLTRSLAEALAPRGIRVNSVAPGPVWTPLIPASFDAEKMPEFGKDTPLGRPAQPAEMAPAYVFLASAADSGFVSGETILASAGKGLGRG